MNSLERFRRYPSLLKHKKEPFITDIDSNCNLNEVDNVDYPNCMSIHNNMASNAQNAYLADIHEVPSLY